MSKKRDWSQARVGDILKIRNGFAVRSTYYCSEGVTLIRQSDIKEGVIDISEAKRVPSRVAEECGEYLVRKGDLLIGMSGSLGKIGGYDEEEPAVQNQRTGLLQMKPGFGPKFAKLVLQFVESQIIAEGKGVAVQNVSAKEIEDLTFPLPPEDERNRIVAEIEKQFTRLDAGAASLKRVQTALKRYRATVLKAACEGRLVTTEAELARKENRSYETGEQLLQRILKERREKWNGKGKYKEPVRPNLVNLPSLPEGWTWASLDQLQFLLKNGISVKPAAKDGLPILRINSVRPLSVDLDQVRYLEARPNDYAEYVLNEGDLLFTRYNGNPELVGVCGVVPSLASPVVHPDKLIRCKLVPSLIIPNFVAIMANVGSSRNFLARRVRTTAGQSGISGGDLKELPIPLAPFSEQERVVADVELRLLVIEEVETVVSTELQRATRLRQSILQQALAGSLNFA